MTVEEILRVHPSPWRHIITTGTVRVMDANGIEVELFTILDFVEQAATKLSPR